MATKWSELRQRLPSVGELLHTPPVEALAERWNRSVVAAGVRSFVEELRADWERHRAGGRFPSLEELATRAARHVARLQQAPLRPAINATGRLLDPAFPVSPLAEESLQAMIALAEGYAHLEPRPGQDAAALVSRLAGAEASTVVHSYSGALWLALATIAAGRKAVVARGDVCDVEPGCSLADLAASAGAELSEIGSVNRATMADYEAAATDRVAALLRCVAERFRVVGETDAVELESLVGLARDREWILIHAMGIAPLLDGQPGVGDWLASVAQSVASGVHLVVVRGDGLVGGPRCGILVGSRDVIRRIERHPMYAAWRADELTSAALQVTLELHQDRLRLQQSVPLFQLLTAPIDNLRHRAERLAPQLAQAADVAAAEPLAVEACLGMERCDATIPSYGVALAPANGELQSLERRLRTAPVPVVGRVEGDRLVLDLRTVFARQDRWLAEIVAGGETAAEFDQPAQQVDVG